METLYYERYIRTKRHHVPSSVLWALNTLQTRSYADSRIATVQIRGFVEIWFCRATVEPNGQHWQHFTGKKQKQKSLRSVWRVRGACGSPPRWSLPRVPSSLAVWYLRSAASVYLLVTCPSSSDPRGQTSERRVKNLQKYCI